MLICTSRQFSQTQSSLLPQQRGQDADVVMVTCCPSSVCTMLRSPEFFMVNTITFPVWLNLGAPARYSCFLLAVTMEPTA